jgi:hypothetical protein
MAPSMMDYEKRISFLNRFFVFQKIATRNVEKLTKSILEQAPDEIEFEDRQTEKAQKAVEETDKKLKPKVKNLKKKIELSDEKPLQVKPIIVEVDVEEVEVKEKHVLEKEKEKEKKKEPKIKKTKKSDETEGVSKKKTRKKLQGDINIEE